MCEKIRDNGVDSETVDEFNSLVTICFDRNTCKREQVYEFSYGLSMGNPLSPILVEVFMDKLESDILEVALLWMATIFLWIMIPLEFLLKRLTLNMNLTFLFKTYL